MAWLVDAGVAGWALLIALVLGLSAVLGTAAWMAAPWLRGLFYRPAHGGGLDVLSSPAPSPLGSMQLDDDRAPWEAHRIAWEWEARPPVAAWLEDDRVWRRQFAATHSATQVQAAFDQQGGWDSGACDDPGGPFMGMDLPPDEAGPGPLLSAPGAGRSPWPGEVAHDEYMAGPAAVLVHPPAPAAGPVPLTTDDLALAAWTRAELSRQDADTLNYLHDYKMRLAS
jgi:hypothetical protein